MRASNSSAPVRIWSKGDDGKVKQSNDVSSDASASNDADTRQHADQDLSGSGIQALGQESKTFQGANTILDLPLYGGVGAVLSVAYLAYLVVRRTKQTLTSAKDDNARYAIGAVTALGGLWGVAFLVGSPLFDYQFWILTAIALA